MYSLFKTKMHCRSMQNFLDERIDDGFRMWYYTMHRKCHFVTGNKVMYVEN